MPSYRLGMSSMSKAGSTWSFELAYPMTGLFMLGTYIDAERRKTVGICGRFRRIDAYARRSERSGSRMAGNIQEAARARL
jgi:hypothetical protein